MPDLRAEISGEREGEAIESAKQWNSRPAWRVSRIDSRKCGYGCSYGFRSSFSSEAIEALRDEPEIVFDPDGYRRFELEKIMQTTKTGRDLRNQTKRWRWAHDPQFRQRLLAKMKDYYLRTKLISTES